MFLDVDGNSMSSGAEAPSDQTDVDMTQPSDATSNDTPQSPGEKDVD